MAVLVAILLVATSSAIDLLPKAIIAGALVIIAAFMMKTYYLPEEQEAFLGETWWLTKKIFPLLVAGTFITGMIGALQIFTQAYVMSDRGRGGPHYASLFYGLYLYQNAFRYFKLGYASALAWILFIIIMLLTLLTFKLSADRVFYQSGGRG